MFALVVVLCFSLHVGIRVVLRITERPLKGRPWEFDINTLSADVGAACRVAPFAAPNHGFGSRCTPTPCGSSSAVSVT